VRILVVSSYPPRHCGIGAYARDQVARLRREGHEVTVLSPPDGDGDLRVPFFGGRPFIRAARIGGRFDRIVVHFQPVLYYRPRAPASKVKTSLGLLLLALVRSRLEILVHEADPPVRWRPDYALLRVAFRRARQVSFHTEAERAGLERDYRIRVRGGVVAHRVRPVGSISKEAARERLGLANGGPVFVCAGFLQPSKGFDRAVEAFAAAAGDGATLYVVGSIRDRTPENEAYVRELAERCQEEPGITLIEQYLSDEDFDLWVAAADWIVLPYRRAWSSGVLARAQALGTPAIVSAVGGLPEQAAEGDLVVDGDEGLARAFVSAATLPGTGRTTRPAEDVMLSVEELKLQRARARERKGVIVLIGLILISVALAATAQLTLKHAMNVVTDNGAAPLSLRAPAETIRRVVLNPSVWGGLVMFGLSASVWLIVLSRASLSFAYPFASLTYVLILLVDRFVLRTPISGLRYAGVALIIGGLVLISRTPHAG
jgi:glycosyltransferase involved in cell wall biosynthesis/multidrug transporter EmrE-like cation transporter